MISGSDYLEPLPEADDDNLHQMEELERLYQINQRSCELNNKFWAMVHEHKGKKPRVEITPDMRQFLLDSWQGDVARGLHETPSQSPTYHGAPVTIVSPFEPRMALHYNLVIE